MHPTADTIVVKFLQRLGAAGNAGRWAASRSVAVIGWGRGDEMTFTVEYEREEDGRWLAEVLELPGVLAYAPTSDEAIAKAQALALRVLADRLEHGEAAREFVTISFAAA
jgi:predicted RNase H-like HicB family nuclease